MTNIIKISNFNKLSPEYNHQEKFPRNKKENLNNKKGLSNNVFKYNSNKITTDTNSEVDSVSVIRSSVDNHIISSLEPLSTKVDSLNSPVDNLIVSAASGGAVVTKSSVNTFAKRDNVIVSAESGGAVASKSLVNTFDSILKEASSEAISHVKESLNFNVKMGKIPKIIEVIDHGSKIFFTVDILEKSFSNKNNIVIELTQQMEKKKLNKIKCNIEQFFFIIKEKIIEYINVGRLRILKGIKIRTESSYDIDTKVRKMFENKFFNRRFPQRQYLDTSGGNSFVRATINICEDEFIRVQHREKINFYTFEKFCSFVIARDKYIASTVPSSSSSGTSNNFCPSKKRKVVTTSDKKKLEYFSKHLGLKLNDTFEILFDRGTSNEKLYKGKIESFDIESEVMKVYVKYEDGDYRLYSIARFSKLIHEARIWKIIRGYTSSLPNSKSCIKGFSDAVEIKQDELPEDILEEFKKIKASNKIILYFDKNGYKERSLDLHKKQLESKKIDTSEEWLYHGADSKAARLISRVGYQDIGTRNGKEFGRGVYFARDLMYSLNYKYSPPDSNGLRVILVNRVLVGKRVATHRGISMLPPGIRSGGNGTGSIIMKPYANLRDVEILYAFLFKND